MKYYSIKLIYGYLMLLLVSPNKKKKNVSTLFMSTFLSMYDMLDILYDAYIYSSHQKIYEVEIFTPLGIY